MYILGVSSFYHDSAAALIKDGKVICAFEEERFTRIKHDNNFPEGAIQHCLDYEGISIQELDYIVYYEKPLLKFERIIHSIVESYPFSLDPFLKSIPEWLGSKIKVENIIRKKLRYKGDIKFLPHHLSHAASGFFTSGFDNSAILTIDGVGEYETTALWYAKGNKIQKLKYINFPHSIGLLYSTFTAFLGFKVNEDEYKVMGLAAYGVPSYENEIKQIINIKEDGSFQIDMRYFSFTKKPLMWSKKFENLFGTPRQPGQTVSKRDKDLAASIQKVMEDIYFKILNQLHSITKSSNLCISGGVGLNALANGKIYQNTPFKKVYIFGASGDGGSAIGAALYFYFGVLFQNKGVSKLHNLSLGSEYSNLDIKKLLDQSKLKYHFYKDNQQLISKTAHLLKQGKIIGWFNGRMEFGPRALGARSILANPKDPKMKDKVNKVKKRELFRPFAGSILLEEVKNYFKLPSSQIDFPFMNFCFQVKDDKRDQLGAITHKDGTCRVQTVDSSDGVYYDLIKRFYSLTKIPCILNTSFNVRGEPIVENPQQAIRGFLTTSMDYLVIQSFLVSKK